ncbi:MAG: hypothetical protein ABJN65_12030 [Parasphingorhabdus sp.]
MKKQKNRRYRNAKISEYKFKKVIWFFAQNLSVREAARRIKLSEPTIANIYMRMRMKLKTNGMFNFQIADARERPAQAIWGQKHRGAPEAHKELHEIETITRIVAAHKYGYVEKLAVSNPEQWERALQIYLSNRKTGRYNLFELPPEGTLTEDGEKQREFDPSDVNKNSIILINEKMIDPNAAFFRYLWQLLLKSPLDASEEI